MITSEPLVGMAEPSTRAKWRALRSARSSTLKKCLTGIHIVREAICQQLRGLAEVFAFIAVENEADDMTRVVDARFRSRREIEVVTLCIGPVHLIQPLSNLRDAKDVA